MRHKISKICAAVMAAALLAGAQPLYAVPTYGTEMPEKNKGEVGYQSHIIFRRDMTSPNGRLQSAQNYLDISYSPLDWLTLDGKIGTGDLFRKGGDHPKVDFGYGFAGGYGFRVKALDDAANRVKVVAGFHHISVHPPAKNIYGDKHEAILDDWEASIVASRSIGIFVPYAGGTAGFNDLIYWTNEIDRKVRAARYCAGVVAGCSVRASRDISINVEGHFIDETSLSTGVYCKF